MANFFDDDEITAEQKSKKNSDSGVRKVFIVVIPLVVFMVASYVFYKFLTTKRDSLLVEHQAIEQVTSGKNLVQLPIEQITTNLAPVNNKTNYLKITTSVVLEVSSDDEAEKAKIKLAEVQDAFQIFLRDIRAADLNGAEGALKVKEELTKRAAKIFAPMKVKEVLLSELLVE